MLKWIKNLIFSLTTPSERKSFAFLFRSFQQILALNNRILERMADMGGKLGGEYVFDRQYIYSSCRQMAELVGELIFSFHALAPKKYMKLDDNFMNINRDIEEELAGKRVIPRTDYVMAYDILSRDLVDVVGGKNANIAEINNRLGLATPAGFAVTARAAEAFLEFNDLQNKIPGVLKQWEEENKTTEEASEEIMGLITSGRIPPLLHKSINKALKRLQQTTGAHDLLLAIRSSAVGEDGEHSFAGQHLSLINQPQQRLLQCYKAVLASTYSASAMEYRRQKGYTEQEVTMAVACQMMIDAKVSGVLYTLDPLDPNHEVMMISATWGLGAPLVAGEVKADQFIISRESPHVVQSLDIVRKPTRLVGKKDGDCEFQTVEETLQMTMCLTEGQIKELADKALAIERYFRRPQDIEWAIDQDGQIRILQARPLNIQARMGQATCDLPAVTEKYPTIFSGKGTIVQNGIATGKVFVVKRDKDLDQFPSGAILVSRETSPRFAKVAAKAGGIITDVGSATGHMATISREFRVPTVVNTAVATALLKTGQEITLDAEENVVYEGRIKELCFYEFMSDAFEETYEYRLLGRVLKKITPLNLLDPRDKNFTPASCKTYHDITRFIHEKAVEELIDLNCRRGPDALAVSKKLKSDIPLDLIIIDIDGGLKQNLLASSVTINNILSVPMVAFLKGLGAPGAWSREPMSVDFSSFMSSLTRTFSTHLVSPRDGGQNLAVISGEYANISLRLGYHFNMIDAYIGQQVNDNYAYFRFLGGVTDATRRSRRAKFIYDALAQHDFNVDLRGDLVIGRVKKLAPKQMEQKMYLLGQLVGFTRQLDVRMNSDQQIEKSAGEFERLINMGEAKNELGR